MSNQRRNNGLFWLGLVAGAAAGYWLNSDKGRKFQQDTADRAKVYGSQIKENSQQQIEQLSSNVNKWIEQGQSYASDLQTVMKDKINTASAKAKTVVNNTESSFQKGARKAKEAVRGQKKQLKNSVENGTV
ncbi:MAG: YtxH domain-containing protein [Bacteroidota bacterium]